MVIDRQIENWSNPPADWVSYKVNIPQEVRMKAGILRTIDKRERSSRPTLRDIYVHWIEWASENVDALSVTWGHIPVNEYYNKPVLWFHPDTWGRFNTIKSLIDQKKLLTTHRRVSIEKIIIHFLIIGCNESARKETAT